MRHHESSQGVDVALGEALGRVGRTETGTLEHQLKAITHKLHTKPIRDELVLEA